MPRVIPPSSSSSIEFSGRRWRRTSTRTCRSRMLVGELAPARDHQPPPDLPGGLCDAECARRVAQLSNLKMKPAGSGNQTRAIRFDLEWQVLESPTRFAVHALFNTDLFDAATVDRMVGQFETLLQGIVANPTARLSQLPLLGEHERKQVLVDWNRSAHSIPRRPVHTPARRGAGGRGPRGGRGALRR